MALVLGGASSTKLESLKQDLSKTDTRTSKSKIKMKTLLSYLIRVIRKLGDMNRFIFNPIRSSKINVACFYVR